MARAPWYAAACALALGSIAIPARAAAQAYDASYQTWVSATITGEVTPDVVLYVDLNGRFYDDFHPFQVLVRPALGLRVAPGMHVWLGYGWTPSWSTARSFTDEHRLWEQWTWDVPDLPGGIRFYLRSRLEERARPFVSSDVALRFRQFVRLLVPFAPGLPLALSLWDEVFVALTDAGVSAGGALWQRAGFDQNRLFLGLSWTPATGVRVEAGYLNHWVVRPSADDVHHVGALNAFFTIR